VSLDHSEITLNKKRLLALRELQHLQHIHFAPNNSTITDNELDLVRLFLQQLPKLKTVGRELKFSLGNHSFIGYFRSAIYHKLEKRIDCVTFPPHPSCQLGLEEFAATAYFWQPSLVQRLPNLKRLHLKGNLEQDGERIPDTVSELGLNFNSAPWRLNALSPRLRVLCLYKCDIRQLPSGGVLGLCPNLEELRLHGCASQLCNIALNVDTMKRSKLRTLTLSNLVIPHGLLSLLLHAPLLEHVQISVQSVSNVEVQQLVEHVYSGRILQNVSLCYLWGGNLRALELAIQAFCPLVGDVRGTKPQRPPFILREN
jgi:hypothetical protein